MKQYIPKFDLVAEIEKLKKSHDNWSCMGKCFHKEYENLLTFINTLEVKEVDLEKEIDDYMAKEWEGVEEDKPLYDMMKNELSDIAKHFYELGLQVAQKSGVNGTY